MEEPMFSSNGVQLLQRLTQPNSVRHLDRSSPLRSEHFPLQARGREIVTEQGVIVAMAADPFIGEEIARRLNSVDWSDQEDQWAL
jgi:hypothetical protein